MKWSQPLPRWVGGKRWLVPRIFELAQTMATPGRIGTVHERFAGGAALTWAWLEPATCAPPCKGHVLADANPVLMRAYQGLRGEPGKCWEVLAQLMHGHRNGNTPGPRATFESARRMDIAKAASGVVAAWLLYMNRAAINGLYRVNKAGQFNAAQGKRADGKWNPVDVKLDEVMLWASRLQGVKLYQSDQCYPPRPSTTPPAERGDLVFYDPPYLATFDRYAANGFTPYQHVALEHQAREEAERGVHVILSNSDTPATRAIYGLADLAIRDEGPPESWVAIIKGEFWQAEVHHRSGRMNSKGSDRGKVGELLIYRRANR